MKPITIMMTTEEVLFHPKILEFVGKVKELYPTRIYLVGGLANHGHTEHDIDILIESIEGQDGTKLKEFLATLSDWKQKNTEFGCRIRLQGVQFKIDIIGTRYFKGGGTKIEVKGV